MDLVTKNRKKLVIIEDSREVYNQNSRNPLSAYSSGNTLLVAEWTPQVRRDQELLRVLGVLEDLVLSGTKDVPLDLRTILDIREAYKR